MNQKIVKAGIGVEGEVASASTILRKDVYEAGLTARQILEVATKEAQALIDDAERRRSVIIDAARQEGFRQGVADWDDALEAARQALLTLDVKYEPEIIRLAVKIAAKIIGEELRLRPETIVSIARECLRSVRHEHSLTLRVNPTATDEVQRNLDALTEVTVSGRRVQVMADASVAPGGCIIESVVGIIDARLETQLKCLEEILLRVAVKR
jgi:type III secretion protein L